MSEVNINNSPSDKSDSPLNLRGERLRVSGDRGVIPVVS